MRHGLITLLLGCLLVAPAARGGVPSFPLQPLDQTNILGSTVRFDASVEANPPARLQWRAYSGTGTLFTNVAGATNVFLILSNIQTTTRRFALYATNSDGAATSRIASLTVLRPPAFLLDPASTIAVAGTDVSLSASTAGTSPIRYQWLFEGQTLAGRTNLSLSLPRVTRTNEGDYVLVATNLHGAATSRLARVRVIPNPSTLQARVFQGLPPGKLPYRLHVPQTAEGGPSGPLPLVLALHGAGERGNDNIQQLASWPQPMVFISLTNQSRFPLIFVAPQCPTDTDWTSEPIRRQLLGLVDSLVQEFPVDTNRVYVTGLSMGGFGSWELPRVRPSFFAAAVPIAGGGASWDAASLRDLPVWNFHSAIDGTVPVEFSRDMIGALRAIGGRPIYTEYADGGHAIWAQAWATPGLVEWTLAQRRAQPSTVPPRLQLTSLDSEGELIPVPDTNLVLSGTAQLTGESLTSLTWTNLLTRSRGVGAIGANWTLANVTISPSGENPILIVGMSSSLAPGLGGGTTVNDFVRLSYVPPVRLTAILVGGTVRITWNGDTGSYRIQATSELDPPEWVDVLSPATSPAELPLQSSKSFFRVLSGLP